MADESDFDVLLDEWRLQAMAAPPTAPIKTAARDEQWAHFGQCVYRNIHDEKFIKAITTAILASHGKPDPQHIILQRLRVFLLTGTIAS